MLIAPIVMTAICGLCTFAFAASALFVLDKVKLLP